MKTMSTSSFSGRTLVYIFLLYITEVFCDINNPGNLKELVGRNVTFYWNATSGTSILEAKWGLFNRNKNDVTPYFITATKSDEAYSSDLDNDEASSYKGRVHFIGSISKGHAWFMISNLKLNDTKEYAVRITESDASSDNYQVQLTVVAPTVPPITTTAPPTTPTKPTTGTNITTILPSTPVLQLHPKKSVFWQGITIDITCNGVTGNPTLTNLTFLQNGSTIDMLNGITSGNYTEAVLSHALTQPGTFAFSCNATNAAGSSPTSNVVTITVKAKPEGLTTLEKVLIGLGVVAGAILGGLIVYFCIKYFKSGGCSCRCQCTCLSTFPCCCPCCPFLCCRQRSDQNDGKGDVVLKNKVDKEGNDNQTQPTA